MTNRTTDHLSPEQFVATMTERMEHIAQALSTWAQEAPRSLQDMEEHILRIMHDLGTTVVSSLCHLTTPQSAPQVPCACGEQARFVRRRSATVTTLLGTITYPRAYYQCPTCGKTTIPFDAQLQACAGGFSAGLQEMLAFLGATQDSFAQAADVVERLCLVQVCPNSVRAATEDLGQVLIAHEQQVLTTAQETHTPPPAALPAPERLYISMDGVMAHTRESGWKEIKTGCVFTTHTRVSPRRPERIEIRADTQSYIAALTDAQTFGTQLWAEACRRGSATASEVVVLGDGAHWIWNIAERQFPQATQIVDWYHASQYVWGAAMALLGADTPERTVWARAQLDALWAGQIDTVLAALQPHAGKQAIDDAITYYTTHRARMDYATYRERGLQVGSGTVESGCKQLVSARLKLAGMIWDADGAEAVAVVRAWLKSDRWDEAMRLRPPSRRTYQRKVPEAEAVAVAA